MAIQLGSAYGKIALDVSGLLSGTKKGQDALLSFTRVSEQVGETLKNVGTKLTIGLTLPIAAMGAASIKAASSFEETKNKTIVIFGEMGDAILAWSETSATVFGQSRTQALEAASNFAIFGKAAGLAGNDLVQFAERNTELASDLASFFDTSPEEAILAIGAAYRGESEPIRRYGVLLNDAALRQKALELRIIDSLGPLTQQQRILAANALILEQTQDAQGDFARTSDGLANSARSLNARWNDTLVMLGQNLLPIALQVVTALNTILDRFNALTPVQQKMIIAFLGFLAILGPVLSVLGTIASLASSFSGLLGVLSTMGVALPTISVGFTGIAAAAGAVGAALLPILAIIASLILIAGVFAVAWKTNFLGIRDIINTSVRFWTNIIKAFLAFLRGDTDEALGYLADAWQSLVDHVSKVFERFEGIRTAWLNFLSWIQNAMGNLLNYIADAVTNVDWGQLGRFITLGIANGLLGGIPSLILAALQAADAALDTIKDRLGISSPFKAFEELGMFSGQGFQIGLAKAMSAEDIARTMVRPVNQMTNSQQQVITQNFAVGLTVQQVRGMIDQRIDAFANELARVME